MVRELVPLAEALDAVLARCAPLATERLALAAAAGRVLAADALAVVDLPPFATSAMDGYAARAADVPGRLRVVGASAAGQPAAAAVGAGKAVAIATGGALPAGADAVVPIEDVVLRGNEIEVPAPVGAGASVRPQGGDVGAGEVAVPAGARLTAARIGALAAAGVDAVDCRRRPRVAVLPTGSELRRPGEQLAPGEIYEANGAMLAAALERAGAAVRTLPVVADDEAAHRRALARGLEAADVLVTSGGVSVGPHDLVRRVAADLGVEEVFWGVAVKPGKPLAFGVRGSTLVFGLPGNPVSSLVGLALFVLPAVRALEGDPRARPEFQPGVLARAVRRNRARDQLLRARASASADGVVLDPLSGQESHMIVRSAAADALVLVERGDGDLARGARVGYLPLP
ncbi:MAG: molybdopterin molybdotransferase MoeA [Thermoleophilia bacterium]|nr:molybdopterin molybdotransferase MoeA [Thermoleophilia bacterium]